MFFSATARIWENWSCSHSFSRLKSGGLASFVFDSWEKTFVRTHPKRDSTKAKISCYICLNGFDLIAYCLLVVSYCLLPSAYRPSA